ncbi:MAG: hypothetical protein RLZZ490_1844 [Cyanobacteriota bacterium]|jgi:hypothetical protein
MGIYTKECVKVKEATEHPLMVYAPHEHPLITAPPQCPPD